MPAVIKILRSKKCKKLAVILQYIIRGNAGFASVHVLELSVDLRRNWRKPHVHRYLRPAS